MNQTIDLTDYKKIKAKFFENYPQWAFYLKTLKGSKNSYLLYRDQKNTREDIQIDTKKYALRWEMPIRFETENRRFTFTSNKLNLGIFRFPLNTEGKKVDILLSDPGKLTNINEEDVIELIDSEIINFDANKIDIIYFELDEIPEEELIRVQKIWESKKFKAAKKEIDAIREFMALNYKQSLTNAFQKVQSYPNYLDILRKTLDKKISGAAAEKLTNGIISNIII